LNEFLTPIKMKKKKKVSGGIGRTLAYKKEKEN